MGERPGKCPKCGSDRIRRIFYGLPSAEALDEAREGSHLLGGCEIFGNDPEWGCLDCAWREAPPGYPGNIEAE